MLQDTTSEHEARERADRSVREIDDWFDLSPVGMVLFDDSGLLVRTNLAFDEMIGSVPVSLAEASPSVATLLAWGEGGALRALRPGSRPIESQGWVTQPGGQMRRLRAVIRCYRTAGGERRYMGVVEDRSIEEERDLAQIQIGAMMDTAGVGIATFQESSGWVGRRPAAAGGASVLLQNISRDIVAPESLAEYERLQAALKGTQRAEVRYAIEHPELGRRWLLTRVEPATLASGKKTASVVTLDVTDRQRSQARSDQLLREMTTILESTTAGIAYLRGGMLVRCNRRFETMLRLPPGTSAGATLAELLARHPDAEAMATEIRDALIADATYEIEFASSEADDGGERPLGRAAADQRWFSLSVRGVGAGSGDDEAIAVLSDVTPTEEPAGPARDAGTRPRIDGAAHPGDPRLGAGRHRHRRPGRHRVDEPLGAAHVRRRAGRVSRCADRDRGHRRGRPSVSQQPLPRRAARGRGRDLRVPGAGARRPRVLGRRQCRRHRPRRQQLAPAHLRPARHRAAARGRGRGVAGAGFAAPGDRRGAAGDRPARCEDAARWCSSTRSRRGSSARRRSS